MLPAFNCPCLHVCNSFALERTADLLVASAGGVGAVLTTGAVCGFCLLLLQVVVREESKHWYKFLTTLCAGELRWGMVAAVESHRRYASGCQVSSVQCKRSHHAVYV
jgi:putative exporter of polyketide antibiotics